ncbi:MAG TPA: hypothetical protein VMS17_02575 [Gemmataceae bacterium]|nr:hypothetical protein [Gemmataceae bacterium]
MVRAVLMNGLIYPLEPLPPHWKDGRELVVEAAEPDDPEAIERWARELEAMCADKDPEEWEKVQAAIDELRQEAKAQARREMGLPDEPIVLRMDLENP